MSNMRPAPSKGATKPRVYAQRQLGPDAVLYLREVSWQLHSDPFRLERCKVQLAPNGTPAAAVDIGTLEEVGNGDPQSYRRLIVAARKASVEFAEDLASASHQQRHDLLHDRLAMADRKDGFHWWVLSSPLVRRHLFPAAYIDAPTIAAPRQFKRIDWVRYRYYPRSRHNGKVAELKGLTPRDIARFFPFAVERTQSRIDPAHVTPFTAS